LSLLCSSRALPPPRPASPPFPYTTLFRSSTDRIADTLDYKAVSKRLIAFVGESRFELVETLAEHCAAIIREEFGVPWLRLKLSRSEEHTSELQSRENLVCRLLLEKKNMVV